MSDCFGKHRNYTRTEIAVELPVDAMIPTKVAAISCDLDSLKAERCNRCGLVERYQWLTSNAEPLNIPSSRMDDIVDAVGGILAAAQAKAFLRVDTLEWRIGHGHGTPTRVTHFFTTPPRITVQED